MAAVLACGPRAVLSHRAAGAHHELLRSALLEVTVPRWRPGPPGVLVHESPLLPDEITTVDGIPVTTVPRTLFDLAAVLPEDELEHAVNEVAVRKLTDALSVLELLEHHPYRPGNAGIRPILERLRPRHLFVAGRWYQVDCLWREERVIVELDGRSTHSTLVAFENDRARDRALQVAGWRVLRVTWRQLHEDADALALDLRTMLRAGKKRA